jgi:hypothetical protein
MMFHPLGGTKALGTAQSYSTNSSTFRNVRLGAGTSSSKALKLSRSPDVRAGAKPPRRQGGMGFVQEDNSGKANIFAVEPRTLYTSSPRADKEARKGLGGAQGLGLILGIAGVVAVATVGVGILQPKSVEEVGRSYGGGETLQEIAARL